MMWKDPFVPFDRLVSGAGMPQAVEHDAGKLRVFRISAQLFFPLPLNTAGGVPPCRDPAAEGPVQFEAAAAAGAVQCFAHKIGNLSCFQLPMQILFGMPEDRRKCIPSMVTIMEISVYLEIIPARILPQ